MTDREKVMKGLESCIKSKYENCPIDCPFFASCFIYDTKCYPIYPVIEAACSLLEPIAPSVCGSNEPDGHSSWWYQCGKCKMPIDHGNRFCRRCGREVKWDDT